MSSHCFPQVILLDKLMKEIGISDIGELTNFLSMFCEQLVSFFIFHVSKPLSYYVMWN